MKLSYAIMNNGTDYPSCIKIPSNTNSKQSAAGTMFPQKFDVKEAITLNNELISIANRTFGEGNWSHTVTNQTIDFIEAFMGKYICGCVTFIRIQLKDETFHEDMGYCHVEGAIKGSAVYCARIGSLTDAFKRVLSCFGNELANEIQKLSKKLPNSHEHNIQKDLNMSIPNVPTDILEPRAQSTPLINDQNENTFKLKAPNNQEKQKIVQQTLIRPKSPTEQKMQSIIPVKISDNTKDHFQSKNINDEKQDQKKALSEEELQRLERKRKQMEKQAEYKRLMKEREQQRLNENKKPNPKY